MESSDDPSEIVEWFKTQAGEIATLQKELEVLFKAYTNPTINAAQEKLAHQQEIYMELIRRLKRRQEQLAKYRALRKGEKDLLSLNPPSNLQRLRLQWMQARNEEKESLHKQIKTLDDAHTEKIAAKYEAVLQLDEEHKALSDNFGEKNRTDTTVGHGQIFSLAERRANIYVVNPQLLRFVESYFDPQTRKSSTTSTERGDLANIKVQRVRKSDDPTTEFKGKQVPKDTRDVEHNIPPQCVAIALVLKRAQRCAAEENPSVRNIESILEVYR